MSQKEIAKNQKANVFSESKYVDQKPINLGTYGKGSKRNHDQMENTSKVQNEHDESLEKTEPTENIEKNEAHNEESHKRQKTENDN